MTMIKAAQALAHAAERLAARDAIDLEDDRWEQADGEACVALIHAASLVDLRGLELRTGGDLPRRLGLVAGVEETDAGPVLVLENGRRASFTTVLAGGWVQHPGDDDADDLEATLGALWRRLAETASAA